MSSEGRLRKGCLRCSGGLLCVPCPCRSWGGLLQLFSRLRLLRWFGRVCLPTGRWTL